MKYLRKNKTKKIIGGFFGLFDSNDSEYPKLLDNLTKILTHTVKKNTFKDPVTKKVIEYDGIDEVFLQEDLLKLSERNVSERNFSTLNNVPDKIKQNLINYYLITDAAKKLKENLQNTQEINKYLEQIKNSKFDKIMKDNYKLEDNFYQKLRFDIDMHINGNYNVKNKETMENTDIGEWRKQATILSRQLDHKISKSRSPETQTLQQQTKILEDLQRKSKDFSDKFKTEEKFTPEEFLNNLDVLTNALIVLLFFKDYTPQTQTTTGGKKRKTKRKRTYKKRKTKRKN